MVEVSNEVKRSIREHARAEFPNESLSFLLGYEEHGRYVVHDVHHSDYPNTPSMVDQGAYYAALRDAHEAARDMDLSVIGDVHSHTFPYDPANPASLECAPSEGDLQLGADGVMGICVVRENADGKFSTRLKFYPPFHQVQEVVR